MARSTQDGWTLAELLIVLAIIAILAILVLLVNWRLQIYKGYDARRKSDIRTINRAFEEYYSDTDTYPPTDTLDDCGSTGFSEYLKKIPCDPTTQKPYKYIVQSETDLSQGYRLCAKLQNLSDPDIKAIGCHPTNGCGWGVEWNYCVGVGTSATAAGFDAGYSQDPTPTTIPYHSGDYACTPGGDCNKYDNPLNHGCPVSFADPRCYNLCAETRYRCTD